jgi:hypothetical protein
MKVGPKFTGKQPYCRQKVRSRSRNVSGCIWKYAGLPAANTCGQVVKAWLLTADIRQKKAAWRDRLFSFFFASHSSRHRAIYHWSVSQFVTGKSHSGKPITLFIKKVVLGSSK